MKVWKTLLSVLATLIFATSSVANPLTVATTAPGSFTFQAGAAIARTVVQAYPEIQLRVTPYAGQSRIMPLLNSGEVEMTIANGDDALVAFDGRDEFPAKHKNIRVVCFLSTSLVTMFVRHDSKINTLSDLRGKDVGSGYIAQRAFDRMTRAFLANAGLKETDIRAIPMTNSGSALDAFQRGQIVAIVDLVTGTGRLQQVVASVGALRALPVDDSATAVGRMKTIMPMVYPIGVKPQPHFVGIDSPMNVMALDFFLLTNANVDLEVIYKISRALYGGRDSLVASVPGLGSFDPKRMAKLVGQLPFHEGARQLYSELKLP